MSKETTGKSIAWPTSELKPISTVADGEEKSTGLGNLSSLSAQLSKLEDQHVVANKNAVRDVRLTVVNALEGFRASRYRLGERLAAYKVYYVAEQGWMEAAQAIATWMACNERTIRRILEDFQRASKVPSPAIKAMERLGLDPSARKNAPTVTTLLTMPSALVTLLPDAAVSAAVQSAKRKCDLQADSERSAFTAEERQRIAVRVKIRSALANVSTESKLAVLLAALEEEMYSEWGQTAPVTVTITPRPPKAADDGCTEHQLES
jgi:hypothetical protein